MSSRVAVVVQRVIPHYRTPFFEHLRERLSGEGVALRLLYSAPRGNDRLRSDQQPPDWAEAVASVEVPFGPRPYWQCGFRAGIRSGLVVIEQANRPLLNYAFLAARLSGRLRVGLWGHGRNFDGGLGTSTFERLKAWSTRRVDWCFAYTELSAEHFRRVGVPNERITVVRNSTDTTSLRAALDRVGPAELAALRTQIGLRGDNVGLFVGGLHGAKRLPFLLSAAAEVRRRVPDFELVVVGAGPEGDRVTSFARDNPWVHPVGARLGNQVAPYLKLARVILMPGLVGLVIVDSFVAGVPLVTTAVAYHSPEISYLKPNVNGVVVRDPHDAPGYAAEVVRVLRDEEWREQLARGGANSAAALGVEKMAQRFAEGMCAALAT